MNEQILELLACPVEVDENIAFVFRFGKLLDDIALANTPRTLDENCASSLI